MNAKQLVYDTLEYRSPARAPRQLWVLPWAQLHYPAQLARIRQDFPDDILTAPSPCRQTSPCLQGDKFRRGSRTDEWGCRFENLMDGVAGETKEPLVQGEEWEDADRVHIPVEHLTLDTAAVDRFCREHPDRFILSGCCPRPFERLQFIRGTEALFMDLMFPCPAMEEFIRRMHEHFCRELELWATTGVDALQIMDDWGAQNDLLISPELWRRWFAPLYRDYARIAHSHGKKLFMHSDGHILRILPDLIEAGVDAINAQLFCMGPENLTPFRGRITFWGEIDRQHILPEGTPEQVRQAVVRVRGALWDRGGCIAQCEFGPGAKPENVYEVFRAWNES